MSFSAHSGILGHDPYSVFLSLALVTVRLYIPHCPQHERQPTAAGPSLPSPSDSGDLVEHVPPPPSPLADAGKCMPFQLGIEKWDIAKHLGASTRLSASEKGWSDQERIQTQPQLHISLAVFWQAEEGLSLKWLE